jgi:hypothetical protein
MRAGFLSATRIFGSDLRIERETQQTANKPAIP